MAEAAAAAAAAAPAATDAAVALSDMLLSSPPVLIGGDGEGVGPGEALTLGVGLLPLYD